MGSLALWVALAVFASGSAVGWLLVKGIEARAALARLHLARRLGRVPKPRRGERASGDEVGPWARPFQPLLVAAGEPMSTRALVARIGGSALLGAGLVALVAPAAAALGLVAGGLPVLALVREGRRRGEAIAAKLPDAFDLMARALRAGHAFPAALQMCGRDMRGPLGEELHRVAERHHLGVDLRDCLLELSRRHPGNFDLHLFVSMVLLHQQTGGNLIETLQHLAETIRERAVARSKVRAVTAEVRMSAGILGALPFFVTLVLMWIRPDYLLPLVYSPLGQKFLAVTIVSLAIGGFLMRRLATVTA